MYHDDHGIPHFHARYAEFEAKVAISSGEVIDGDLPARARRRVRTWARLHRGELMADWALAQAERPLIPIQPLP